MASSHVARPTAGRKRTLTTMCAVAGTAIAAAALPMAVGPAMSMAASSAHTATRAQASGLTLSVTSVNPSYATPNHAIKLKGRVWNGGHSSITGLSVQLYSSTQAFTSETALQGFAADTAPVGGSQVAGATHRISKLRGQHGVGWTIDLPVSALRLSCFGVYPLTVKVTDATGTFTASDPVPLPFWPNKPNSCSTATRPTPFAISWIWPLIDSPHQGACPGLRDNSLAASLAPGGRLYDLLSVGTSYAATARLTWAIDPALLDDAATMTQSYQVAGSASCANPTVHAFDRNARAWLSKVGSATTGQPVFVTPYADVDVAGLAQYGDNADLKNAFADGQRLAAPILRRDRVPAALPAASKRLSAVAWPAGGLPSPTVLENLGAMKIGTVILAMPRSQLNYTPGAVTSTIDGVGGVGNKLKVLLGDYSLSNLLALKATNSRRPGTIFNVSQLFLAETAMIVAELPATQRPMVVTPPRRWDPASTLASDLLGDTASAPWLRPMNINQMAAQPEQPYPSSLVRPDARGELPGKLLRQLNKLDHRVALLQSIMKPKDDRLSRAVYDIESAGWAGAGASRARALLNATSQYVTSQFGGLSVGGQRVINVTLGGRVGSVTVTIRNALDYPVQVRLRVTSSNNTVAVTQRHKFYEVGPHSSSSGIKLSVNATQTGKARIKVSLESPTGILLPNPPDKPLIMKISATNLGTVALVIFAAALAIFVIASAAQAIRRGRPGTSQSPVPVDPASDGGPGGDEAARFETRRDEKEDAETERSGAESVDTAGWLPGEDAPEPRASPDRTDNVFGERSELSSVGRRPTKESR